MKALEEKLTQVESKLAAVRAEFAEGRTMSTRIQNDLDVLAERYNALSGKVDAARDSSAEVHRYELMIEAECILRDLDQFARMPRASA